MKTFLKLIGGLLFLLVVVVLVKTVLFKSKQMQEQSYVPLAVTDSSVVRLQRAIQIKTISYDEPTKMDSSAFSAFQHFLVSSYPAVFAGMEVEYVNFFGIVLHWKGLDNKGKPAVLMAHQDVVPIEEATRSQWDADPFSGEIKSGFVYGRGAIDDKGSLIAILEAAETLVKQGFKPKCDIYFVFGHDEEVMGLQGAKAIAKLFKQRNIAPRFVLDEGGIVTEYKVPGLGKTAAVVGIAEKGYQTLKLKINIPGGHSSMPEHKTAIDELAKAVVALKDHPFEAELNPTVQNFLDFVGPEMPFTSKMAMANRWLFAPLIKSTYAKSPTGNATIRTTTATTIFNAGVKENLIPGEAEATVNFRTLPGVSQADVIAHVKKIIDNNQIQIIPEGEGHSPSQVASVTDSSFAYIQKTISAYKKDIVVAPYLVLGATDSRYFGDLTAQVFRFIPFTDPEGFHGVNERIKVSEFKKGIGFYYELMRGM
ncbi:M20/M25/M40 family metallo-hydrolase [Pelobium manganitolerans]|uniref:M20/M25/M40 family metallo-hydrolase n=1 Tax=Pelobium manganitolerans TaxID=1842495 RepID=UPI003FA3D2A0